MARLLKCPKREIRDVNEKAFQRAIFHNNTIQLSTIKGKRKKAVVDWYDFESPIDKNRETNSKARGKLNLDLIGKDRVSNHYIVCEVKFSCNKKDSPQDAANEAYNYFTAIINDASELDTIATHHRGGTSFSWKDILPEETEIWVVANSAYWAYWIGHEPNDLPKVVGEGSLEKRVRCFSVDIPGDYFIEQKGESKVYVPEIPKDAIWTELSL